MKRFSKYKKVLFAVFLNVFGNLLYAMGVILFCEPNNMITGGVTGISLALHYLFDVNTSYFTFIFNAVFFVIGLIVLGKKFALSTLASSIIYPLWMLLLEFICKDYNLTDDLMMATVFGGVLMGVGIGLVMRSGGSTGGVDVIVLILNKYLTVVKKRIYSIINIVIARVVHEPSQDRKVAALSEFALCSDFLF